MDATARIVEHTVWIAVNERGETAASSVSADRAVDCLNRSSLSRCGQIEVHRCRATLPVPVVETVEMEAERVES